MNVSKSHITRFIAIIAILFIVFSVRFCFADVIYLKNGQVLEGVIFSETDDEVVFKLSIGQVTLNKEGIESIEKSPPEDNKELEQLWHHIEQQRQEEFQKAKAELPLLPETQIKTQPETEEKISAPKESPRIAIKNRRIYVNNKLYYVKGVAYGINYPKCPGGMRAYKKIPFSVFEKDFEMMEEAGINTIRTYEPLTIELLDLAHKHNIMVIENIVYPTGQTNFNSSKDLEGLKKRVQRVIKLHKDHPAILAWSIWNDAPFTWTSGGNAVKRYGFDKANDFLKELYLTAKRADSSHLITASNMLGQEGTKLGFDFLDIIGVNAYIGGHGRWLGDEEAEGTIQILIKYSKQYNKPVIILETGYSTYVKSSARKESQDEVLRKQIKITGENIAGITIFQWSDGWWKAGHPEVQNKNIEEHWGIVTGYREPKAGLKAVSEMFNAIATQSKGYSQ